MEDCERCEELEDELYDVKTELEYAQDEVERLTDELDEMEERAVGAEDMLDRIRDIV